MNNSSSCRCVSSVLTNNVSTRYLLGIRGSYIWSFQTVRHRAAPPVCLRLSFKPFNTMRTPSDTASISIVKTPVNA